MFFVNSLVLLNNYGFVGMLRHKNACKQAKLARNNVGMSAYQPNLTTLLHLQHAQLSFKQADQSFAFGCSLDKHRNRKPSGDSSRLYLSKTLMEVKSRHSNIYFLATVNQTKQL